MPALMDDMLEDIVVDLFAGGGASIGIECALGRPVTVAVNHSPQAIAMHEANHPLARHFCEDAWQVDPLAAIRGRPVALLWASPDCHADPPRRPSSYHSLMQHLVDEEDRRMLGFG